MKLKTKLIPLTSLGLIAASTMPFCLTSCGSNSVINKAIDLVQNYYPNIERHENATMTLHEAHDLYVQKITEDPSVFVHDYMWSKSWTGISFEQYLFWQKLYKYESNSNGDDVDRTVLGPAKDFYSEDMETISNLEITTQKVKWKHNGKEEEWNIPLLSFTLHFDSDIKQITLQDPLFSETIESCQVTGTVSGDISFYNVPFYLTLRIVQFQESKITSRVLSIEPFYEWMAKTEPVEPENNTWQIKTVVNSVLSGEVIYTTGLTQRIADDWTLNVTANHDSPQWVYEDLSLEETIGRVFSSSYYLEKIQVKEGE